VKLNHVGITVADIDAAVRFYTQAFGLRILVAPFDASTETEGADRRFDVFGATWGHMKLAHLVNAEGAGFELFQFVRPPVHVRAEGFDYWNRGISHIALTVDDIEGTVERIERLGGRARTRIHELPSGTRICYCADPWGTAIELVTTSYTGLVG
jgi:catechol 2,3-dioxygenase-like lactoylglutathione lyase family enzyme